MAGPTRIESAEDRAEEALVLAPLDGAKMSPMIASAMGKRRSGAESLDAAAAISHSIEVRDAGQDRADQEDADADQEDGRRPYRSESLP